MLVLLISALNRSYKAKYKNLTRLCKVAKSFFLNSLANLFGLELLKLWND